MGLAATDQRDGSDRHSDGQAARCARKGVISGWMRTGPLIMKNRPLLEELRQAGHLNTGKGRLAPAVPLWHFAVERSESLTQRLVALR